MLHLLACVAILAGSRAESLTRSWKQSVDSIFTDAYKGKVADPDRFEDGSRLVELDMRLTKEQYEAIHGKGKGTYKGLRDEASRWSSKTMPYVIADYFSDAHKKLIRNAMDEWEKYTCIKMVPHTNQRNYTRIISASGCWSMVGMNGGRQDLSLQMGSCTYHHTAVHELGHAIGFHHEQTRPDRDDYVTIIMENIISGLEYNFDKYDWKMIDDKDVAYDYLSVMHYSQHAFSKNGNVTILTKDKDYDVIIGTVPGLSFQDIKAANLMYNCSDHCTNECPAKAIRTKDCKCWCNNLNPGAPVVEWDGTGECKGGSDVDDPCVDYNTNCPTWAAAGECDNDDNAYWMNSNCMKSCKVCGPVDDRACRDFDKEFCPYWSMIGECERNPGWMMINCRFSCRACGEHPDYGECEDRFEDCAAAAQSGVCESNAEAMLTNCPVSCKVCGDNVECKNWDYRCNFWKDEGKCSSDEKFMKLHCSQECGFCTGGTLPKCRDYGGPSCPYWAKNGECSYNPGFMARKCPLSCRVCGNATQPAQCIDNDPFCHEWWFQGNCDTDKPYMHLACRAQCGICTGDPLDKPGCKNYDHNCERWVNDGECDINPSGMLHFCPRGCKACGAGTLCKDWHNECPSWKADGDCNTNKVWMDRNCPKSCNTCCTDPDGCDIIGGPKPGNCKPYPYCYDDTEYECEKKAAAGECAKDPDDMLRFCPLACKICGNESSTVCADYKDECGRWAFVGECVANPGYMEMYCRKSCRCCEAKEPPAEICRDIDCREFPESYCKERAARGECKTNANDMLVRCPISCKVCGEDAECNDFNEQCHHWAQIGECKNNKSFMHLYCRKSCRCC